MNKVSLMLVLALILVFSGCSISKNNQTKNEKESPVEQTSNLQKNDTFVKEEESTTNLSNQSNSTSTIQNQANKDWSLFESAYFTLSFKIPTGFEVKDSLNKVLIAKSPYYTRDIGDDNAFLYINRYNQNNTRNSLLESYKKSLKNWKESQVVVDGLSFPSISGTDIGSFEGDSAGRIVAIFFDASWLQITERPTNQDQDFNPIQVGNEILETLKFSKNEVVKDLKTFKNDDYYFEFSGVGNSVVSKTIFGEKQMLTRWKDGKSIVEATASPYYSVEMKAPEKSSPSYFFRVVVYPKTSKTLNEIILANSNICKSNKSGVVCESTKINNTVDAYKITYNSTQAVPGSDYYFIYKGNYYLIQHSVKSSLITEASNIGEEIFNTFKLLK